MIKVFIAAILIIFVTCQSHAGFMLFIVAFVVLPSTINSFYHFFKSGFTLATKKHLVILFSIAVSSAYHLYLYNTAASKAVKISTAINEYQKTNGKYPRNISDVAASEQDIKEIGIFYDYSKEVPFLMYESTFLPFEIFTYDFKNKIWQTQLH